MKNENMSIMLAEISFALQKMSFSHLETLAIKWFNLFSRSSHFAHYVTSLNRYVGHISDMNSVI